jgi:hypothetical protein
MRTAVAIAAARSLSRPPTIAPRVAQSLAHPLAGSSQPFSQPSRWMSSSAAIRFSRNHLSLYRQLLRAHAERLPAAQRELGDAYVKSEFRSHRDADAKFLAAFESQWRRRRAGPRPHRRRALVDVRRAKGAGRRHLREIAKGWNREA